MFIRYDSKKYPPSRALDGGSLHDYTEVERRYCCEKMKLACLSYDNPFTFGTTNNRKPDSGAMKIKCQPSKGDDGYGPNELEIDWCPFCGAKIECKLNKAIEFYVEKGGSK